MDVYAVIAEFNPFTKAHERVLSKIRSAGASHIIAIMSGDYVQRGTFAVFDKYVRAKCALACGADLVVELPVIWSLATAERFAFGGAAIADLSGIVSHLAFGAETDDIELLKRAAATALDPGTDALVREYVKNGSTYPQAQQAAMADATGIDADIFRAPNNILAIEYLKALIRLRSAVAPVVLKREGQAHGETLPDGQYSSASAVRAKLLADYGKYGPQFPREELTEMMPSAAADIVLEAIREGRGPADPIYADRAMLAVLRRLTPSDYLKYCDVSEGLENRLYRAVCDAADMQSALALAQTGRYTNSRIRRAYMTAYLGINKDLMQRSPQYIRVLGFTKQVRQLLSYMHDAPAPKLPCVVRNSDLDDLPSAAREIAEVDSRARDLYSLACRSVRPCGTNETDGIVVL